MKWKFFVKFNSSVKYLECILIMKARILLDLVQLFVHVQKNPVWELHGKQGSFCLSWKTKRENEVWVFIKCFKFKSMFNLV